MRFIQKIPITKSGGYYKLLLSLAILPVVSISLSAQTGMIWEEISLIDTFTYTQLGTGSYNSLYPSSNLLDANFKTCWVGGSSSAGDTCKVFIRIPDIEDPVFFIFPGYGKNEDLFFKNSRPKTIRLSVYAAVNPEGFVSENAILYKAAKFPKSITLELADSFGLQSIPLYFPLKQLDEFREKVIKQYHADFQMPIADTCMMLKLEVLKTRAGSKYDDICISEVFFNNCYIAPTPFVENKIENVYLNKNENALWIENKEGAIEIYRDGTCVFQILEVSDNKKWAILIEMPANISGRAETVYLLVDLINQEIVNSKLDNITGTYSFGSEMYFNANSEKPELLYYGTDGELRSIELR